MMGKNKIGMQWHRSMISFQVENKILLIQCGDGFFHIGHDSSCGGGVQHLRIPPCPVTFAPYSSFVIVEGC